MRRKKKPSRTISDDFSKTIIKRYYSTRSRVYKGLAADFDGTLAWIAKRDDGPPDMVMSRLSELLKKGCVLVVLTGRGRSIIPFFKHLVNRKHCICLCLYNGAKIVQLGTDLVIFEKSLQKSQEIYNSISSDTVLTSLIKRIDVKEYGIQLFPKEGALGHAFSQARMLIKKHGFNKLVNISSSGWTIDITPKDIDKKRALDIVIKFINRNLKGNDFLKLGDQGHYGGNDFQLLKRRHSFSVNTISGDPNSCFPVVDPTGRRLVGPQATSFVLARTAFKGP